MEWLLFLQWLERYFSPHPIFSRMLRNPTLKFVGPSIGLSIGLSFDPSITFSPSITLQYLIFCGDNFSTPLTLIVTNQVMPIGTDFVNHNMLVFMAVWSILNLVAIYLILRY